MIECLHYSCSDIQEIDPDLQTPDGVLMFFCFLFLIKRKSLHLTFNFATVVENTKLNFRIGHLKSYDCVTIVCSGSMFFLTFTKLAADSSMMSRFERRRRPVSTKGGSLCFGKTRSSSLYTSVDMQITQCIVAYCT